MGDNNNMPQEVLPPPAPAAAPYYYPPPAGYAQPGYPPPPNAYPPQGYPPAGYQTAAQQQPIYPPSAYTYPAQPYNGQPPPAPAQTQPQPDHTAVEMPRSSSVLAEKLLTPDIDKSIRMAFIRKVYGILTVQLFLTFGIALIFNLYEPAGDWLARNPTILIPVMIVMCGTVCGLTCVPKLARTVPTNYILLGCLSLAMGVLLGFSAASVDTYAFSMAMGITATITLGVSLFACQSKIDFTGFGVFGFVMFLVLMIFGLMCAIFRSRFASIAYASLGAALFSFYLVMDTQKIVGGKHRKYQFTIDDYAFAVLALYMDIINLFMYILQIMALTDQ